MRARRVWIQRKRSKRTHIRRSTADCAGATWTRESRPQEVLQCDVLLFPVLYTRDSAYFSEFLFLRFWGCESKSLFLRQQTLSWIEMQVFHSCHCCGTECAKYRQTADVFQAESSLQCEEIFPLVQKKFLSFQKMMQNSGFYIPPYKYKCLYVIQWTRGITILPVCSYESIEWAP